MKTIEEIKEAMRLIFKAHEQDITSAIIDVITLTNEYQETVFYKQTGLSIVDYFCLLIKTDFLIDILVDQIQTIVNKLDLDKLFDATDLGKLFEQIPEEYQSIFQTLLQEGIDNTKDK